MICPFLAFLLKIFFTWPVLAVGLPIALQTSGMYTGITNSCYINIEKTWQGDLLFSSTSLTLQLEEKGRQPKSVVRLSGLGQCLQLGRREAGRRGEASWHSRPPAPQSRSPWPHGGYFLDFQDFSSYVQSDKPSC